MFDLYQPRQSLFGRRFDFSARVKGQGKVRLGAIIYEINEKNQKNHSYSVIWSKEIELSESWRKVIFSIDLSHRAAVELGLRIEVTTAGNVCVDEVSLQQLLDPSVVITPTPEIVLLRDMGKAPELSFSISKPKSDAVMFTTSDSNYTVPSEVKPDDRGIVKIDREKIVKAARIQLASGGVGSTVFVENLPGGVFEELRDPEIEVVLTGECCEWMLGEYARDAGQLGMKKTLMIIGHIPSEKEGMRLLADLMKEKLPQIETKYFECGEVCSEP